ncbi:MAG TPA: amino acid adenylation domain-containing protein [Longimicrobium sp.]
MSISELLNELRDRGIVLACEGDELLVRSMKRAMDPGLVAALRANKPALLELMRSGGYAAAMAAPPSAPLLELTEAEREAIAATVPGGAENVQDIYPLAPLQEGILFHHLMTTEGDPYLLGSLHAFASRDDLDRYLVALRAVMGRHDILRTAVRWEGLPEPVQVVLREAPLTVEEEELDAASGMSAGEQLYARFDPRHHRMDVRQAPLMRAHVARDAAGNRWLLLLLRHHLISDHATLEVLQSEIDAHLSGRAHALPAALPFRDFVAQARNGVSAEEHQAFFTEMLGDVEQPTAPFGVLDVRGDGSAMREARLELDGRLAARLRERARALGVSAASVFHVAWAQVLARAAGLEDVVFGTLLLGRMHGGEGASRVMGPFINTLPLRVRLGAVGAQACVRQTHAQLAMLMRHEHASLALAQRCSAVEAPSPLFTTLLNFRHSANKTGSHAPAAAPAARAGGMIFAEERSNYPLAMSVDDLGEGFRLKGQVMHASLDPVRVCGFMHRALEGLVEALETAPSRAVGAIDVLPAEERARVLEEWNRTDAPYAGGSCIHELFQAWVERAPDAEAVASGDERWSYGELNARANRLAHHLRARGVGPDVRVGISVERGPEMVAAVLAVLKAGGAYVPLDPSYPADRLAYMLADSAPAMVLTQDAVAETLADVFAGLGADVPVLRVDASTRPWAAEADTDPARGALTPEHAAYVIYTSGSTGRPKGVLVPHRGLCNVAAAQQRAFGVGAGDRVLQFASLSFDAAAFELVMALASGAALCVASRDELLPGPGLLALLRRQAITTVTLPPSALAALPVEELPALRTITTAGEALPAELAARWGARHRLWNLYGPTEATIWSTVSECADPARTPDIGQPIANTRAYVLDAALEPLPVDVAGELYVGGAGVARGYLGRPALTAERFVPDPFGGEPGARLYRTGDLCRWSAEGALDFIGRVDHQVKVRGFRIEPGEIEARLVEHAGVDEAVVVAREEASGETRLVAYVVADATAGAEVLRAHLGERLPAHMVPAAFVRLDAFPLTPNGKLDRRALPAPGDDAFARRGYEAPVGETEQALAEVWADVLRVERVGRWDDFFELGGHSLLAVRVISRVRQVLAVEVALAELFAHPVLAEFARELETAVRSELPPIEPVAREGGLPLSFAQQRLWFLEQLGNLGSTYHVQAPMRLRGTLNRAALVHALDTIVARHEALRTTFTEVDGVPEQRIAPVGRFALVEHDLGGGPGVDDALERLMEREVGAPFDLERGPLIRGALIRLADDDHVLMLTMHHIVSDGWSMGVFFDELASLYAAHARGTGAPLAELPVQYADYAAWQRKWVEGDVLRAQGDYWARALAGAPELLELPTDHPRPAQVDHAGELLVVELDEELTAGLKALGRRHGTTLFITLLAGWAVVLSRLSGRADVVIGTPVANRGRREIEGLIGFFVNTLALRVDLSDAPTVAGLLARVKERALGAQHHQDIPFEQVVERVDPARSLSHAPLFQAMFTWQDMQRGGGLSLPGLQVGRVGTASSQVQAKVDLALALRATEDRIVGSVTYATALFERETVERWAGYLRRVLEEMAADELRPVERLSLMPEGERTLLLEGWNRTEADYPRDACVHQLFETQAARTPDAEAVVFEGEHVTYGELNARANRLAHHLRALGVGPDVRVGLCVERSLELVVALLALLKAGGAYVALDPDLPDERLRTMLEDSRPPVLLAHASLAGRFAGMDVPVLAVDADAPRWAARPETNPEGVGVGPDHLVYVIYTSGSTGKPKGVMNVHRNVVNRIAGIQHRWRLDAGESVLQNASLSFDVSAYELFWPLMLGARVVMPRPDGHRDPAYLVQTIRRYGIGTASFVPSSLQVFLEEPGVEGCTSLVRVPCGGEALPPALVRRLYERLPHATLYNRYGPSEAATAVTGAVRVAEEMNGPVPIGRPMPNARAYLLDRAGEPVPMGVAGELCIGGDGVGRGYLDRPGLTADRFVPDPFSGHAGARMYRTGDLARWKESAGVRECGSAEASAGCDDSRTDAPTHSRTGVLEYLGRTDFQVKVRGFRIEPGEIEARLLEHPGVREAVVLVREDAPGDRRLVAYVVADETAGAEVLRAHVGQTLPEYMVPAAYVRLEQFPLSPNGKLDRPALPAPEGDAYAAREYEAPVGETEQALAEIWAEVLGTDRVGRRDNFFELGGHSLLVVRVIARMRQRGLYAEVRALFTAPTLAALAAQVGGESEEVEVPANAIPAGCERITPDMLPLVTLEQAEIDAITAGVEGGARNVQDIYPLAPLQEGILFHHLMSTEGDPYLLGTLYSFDSRAELDRYLGALQAVMDRHDVLRTAVRWDGVREPVQVVWRHARLVVEEVELDPADGDLAKQLYARFDPRHHRIDVRRAPLMRAHVAPDAAGSRWLLMVLRHHLVSDHTSLEVMQTEIDAHLAGRADTLPAPLPFRDLVAQTRLGARQAEHEAFFREMLGDVDEPTAPFGLVDARGDGSGMDVAAVWVEPRLAARLRERARALGVSPAALCHVAWAQVLARVSGREDVVFGTLLLGRMTGGENAERMMGPFINTLPIRIRVGDVGAEASVRDTHALLTQLLRHEHAPLALAQRCSRVEAPAPLFTALLNYRHSVLPAAPAAAGAAPDGMRRIYAEERSNYPLTLNVDDVGEAMGLTAKVRTPVEARRVCSMMHAALAGLVEALATAPGRPVGAIEVLPAEERARVVHEWNRTDAPYPRELCTHHLFEAQAARTPHAVAVTGGDGTVTYAELNARANRLAHHLMELGVGPDVLVGICTERGVEMAVGLLAVLKAGGAYVPLDPDYPADRLRHMVEDAAPAAVLAYGVPDALVWGLVGESGIPVIRFETDGHAWAHRPDTNPARTDVHPSHLVYVIYTSGSTGRPKGVMNHHGCLVNRLAWGARAWSLTADDVLLCKTSLSFDGHIRELFLPWSVGARVVMARPGGHKDPDYLLDAIHDGGITMVNLNGSLLLVMLESPRLHLAAGLRQMLVGGESFPGTGLIRFLERLPGTVLHHLYGPSEAATAMMAPHLAPAQAQRVVPIGRPTANARMYLLDPAGNPVPVGAVGEMYVGGHGVARGYLGRAALTAERFVPDPFSAEPGARLYRTGDLGRWLADGMVEFLGRNDFQVKVRGFRIELGEVEVRLLEHPAVREVVVMARPDANGDNRLIAWYTGDETDAAALRAHLAERLPDYMVPVAFVRMERFPLTPSVKLDRAALPEPEGDAYAVREYEAPADEDEEMVAGIWAEVLRVERVGRHDDFFALGGHSLSAVRVISRVRQELGVDIALRELFTWPVLKDFAQVVLDAQLAQFDPEALAGLVELAREPALG